MRTEAIRRSLLRTSRTWLSAAVRAALDMVSPARPVVLAAARPEVRLEVRARRVRDLVAVAGLRGAMPGVAVAARLRVAVMVRRHKEGVAARV